MTTTIQMDKPKSCDECKLKYMGVCVANTGRKIDPTDESTWCPLGERHGRWIEENNRPRSTQFICSVCGGKAYYPQHNARRDLPKKCKYKYCPSCCARMDGTEKAAPVDFVRVNE